MPAANPYATALALGHAKPNWTPNSADADRVATYWTYADIYHNVDTALAAVLRDADGEEIGRRYIPAARTIVEATNRYLCKDPEFITEVPLDVTATADDTALVSETFKKLFDREEFAAKFLSLKRWMLIRGDAMLHVSADPTKPEGTRLRITELSPEHYFPIFDPTDSERVIGAYVVQIILDDEDKEIAQRIEYHKVNSPERAALFGVAEGTIFYRLGFFEADKWDDRAPLFSEVDLKPVDPPEAFNTEFVAAAMAGYALPTQITAIPLYHFRNNREGTAPFGTSEIQGIETLLAGITQTVTDEDIAVALQGIGVYYTDSGRPVDENGDEVDWVISPASMLEIQQGAKIGRVAGADNITSMIQHTDALKQHAQETTGTPDVAVGKVDVQVAQSGIALAIQMAPITAKNGEKTEDVIAKLDQLLWDLMNGWLPAYEGFNGKGIVLKVRFGDPLPVNRTEVVKEVTELVKNKVISVRFACQILKDKLGYDIDPAAMVAEIAAESAQLLDATASRMEAELNAPPAA